MDAGNGRLLAAAVIASALAVGMMMMTRNAMEAATGGAVSIVDLELAWSGRGFEALAGKLAPTSRAALVSAHSIDSVFALSYSVAIAALLAWLRTFAPLSDIASWLSRAGWLGLSAGAFDSVENFCLQRCLRAPCFDGAGTAAQCIDTLDGPLHIAAIMASIKFVLVGVAFAAIAFGVLYGAVSLIAGRFRSR